MNGESFNVLAMSGGGARVVYMARILDLLARHTGAKITDFDMIAMNSASTALGLGLSVPDPDHPEKPRYRAEDGPAIAREIAPQILNPRLSQCLQLKKPYSTTHMEKILRETLFGDTRLDQAVTRHIFSIHKNNVPGLMTNFNSAGLLDAPESGFAYAGDMPMSRAATAAMALRPLFSPLVSDDGAALSDGGMSIPFPAMEARQSAKHLIKNGEARNPVTGVSPSQTVLFGLTHGYEHKQNLVYAFLSTCGAVRREIDMIGRESRIMNDLEAIVVHEELNDIRIPDKHPLYERCHSMKSRISESLVDASPRNMDAMEEAADIVFGHRLKEFERLGARLLESREKRQSPSPDQLYIC